MMCFTRHKRKNAKFFLSIIPVHDGKRSLVRLCLSTTSPIHVWLTVNYYQVQCEDDNDGDEGSYPVDEEHDGHTKNESE